jgi:sporulation protein YlmC with PRC-barrel domain
LPNLLGAPLATTDIGDAQMRISQTSILLTGSALVVALAAAAIAQENIEAEIVPLADWGYDELYADGISVEEMLDADVNGPTGDDIGDVENVLFDEDGRVLSVIAEVGGLLEIGDTHVNIPWERISAAAFDDGIEIDLTQEAIEEFTLLTDEYVTVEDTSEVQEVGGDNAGVVATGPQVWRATDVIGDTARLREDGEAHADYGYVDDIIIRGEEIAAVVVGPGAGLGAADYYAYPYYSFRPGPGYYDLPYTEAEVEGLEPFDEEAFED